MAINKITPRALDKSTDHKLVPATAFIDAVNVVFGEDESNGEGDSGGDAGVIKNLRGNSAVFYHREEDAIAPGDFKIIGTTTDHKLKLVYFYVYHEDINEQGVWVYDPYGKLSLPTSYAKSTRTSLGLALPPSLASVDPREEQTIKCVVKGPFFNFSQNSVVQGSVAYNNTLNVPANVAPVILGNASLGGLSVNSSERATFEKDINLFFTDNVNEPKKICVNACLFARALKTDPLFVLGEGGEFRNIDVDGDNVITFAEVAVVYELLGTAEPSDEEVLITIGPDNTALSSAPGLEGNTYLVTPSAFDIDGDGSIAAPDVLAVLGVFGLQIQPDQSFPASPSEFLSYEGGVFRIPDAGDPETTKILFCHACKPTPLSRPTFSFREDPGSKSNNFIDSLGFKFAYQIEYFDGSLSPISPKSDLAIPPSLLYQGNNRTPSHESFNLCEITVLDPDLIDARRSFIKSVRFLAQEGQEGYKLIKKLENIPAGTGSNLPLSIEFKNDQIGIPVSDKEENKFFESVPQKAEAQSIVDNRLMYGNYVEGYPNHPVQASLNVLYQDRPSENFGAPIKVEPSVSKILTEFGQPSSIPLNDIPEKQSGFRITIEDGDFPTLEAGNYIELNLSFLPQRNFHLYKADESYHQSTVWGINSDNSDSLSANGYTSTDEAGQKSFFRGPQPGYDDSLYTPSGVDDTQNPTQILGNSFSINSKNEGIGSAFISPVDSYGDKPSPTEVFFGTSAANPFVIPGARLDFSIRLRCDLGAEPDTLRASFFELVDDNLGFDSNSSIGSSNTHFSVVDVKRIHEHEWDLEISNFQKFQETDGLAKLISLGCSSSTQVAGHLVSVLPKSGRAFFGVSRRSIQSNVEVEGIVTPFNSNKSREYSIYLDCIPRDDLKLWTCVRKWMPESPWWVLSKDFLEAVSDEQASMSVFYEQTQYQLPDYAYEDMIFPGRGNEAEYPAYLNNQLTSGDTAPPGGFSNVAYLTTELNGQTYRHQGYYRLGAAEYEQNGTLELFDSTIFFKSNGDPLAAGRALFEQFNDVTDFSFPGSLKRFDDSDVYTYGASFHGRSKFFISIVTPQSRAQNFSSNSQYFAASPTAQNLNFPSLGVAPATGGVTMTLLDGEGGPGGSQAPDQLELGFEHLSKSPGGRNPAYAGLQAGSTAFGHTTRGYKTFDNFSAIPAFFGPFFTGRIFSTHTVEVYRDQPISNAADVMIWRDYNYQALPSSLNAVGVNYSPDSGKRTGVRSVLPYVQGEYNGLIKQAYVRTQWNLSQWYSDATLGGWDTNKKLPFTIALRQSLIEPFGAPGVSITNSVGGSDVASGSLRSFKANSDHEFGVVFYDSHGRRSFVNPVGSVYVEGFSDSERGSGKGQSRVRMTLSGNPPQWAHKYQVVYGGNKSAGDFIQYTTNNAYVANTDLDADQIDTNSGKIYVSLNALQGSSISYAQEFGAKGDDGSSTLYKYSSGDKLRIISYGDASDRVYPSNLIFDVVDVVTFDPASGAENNPLVPPNVASGAQYFGEFLVLSNNTEAEGFNYASLLTGGISNWDQNVVFEIFSPKKFAPSDTQVYEEIGDVYDVLRLPSGETRYSEGSILLYEGDVFFRPTACNVNEEGDLFAVDDDGLDGIDNTSSNFQNVILESRRASDLTPAKIENIGRRNVESSNARTVRREAGIIYSERNNPESDLLSYSSFNASLFPFKDLEERFGNINFIDELGGNLFVIQQDRCSLVPVSSTILSNAVGQEQLIASNEVLGKERVYSIVAGSDNNPESVVRVNNTYYFAHKSLGKVFRFTDGQGIEEISDVNMGAFFRSKFKEAIGSSALSTKDDIRIVGGYDPVKEEYLLSILKPLSLEQASNDDSVVIYGCQDPDAANYNPNATRNNGECIFEDDPTGPACARGNNIQEELDFGKIETGSITSNNELGVNMTITNEGESDLIIADIFILGNPAAQGVFSATVSTYLIEPGASTPIKIFANAVSEGVVNGTVVIEFLNSASSCPSEIQIPVTAQILDDVTVSPEGVATINFYLGGTLIDQQFADVSSGIWNVRIDQNRVIQAVSNSYSGNGSKALLEVEVILDQTIGVDILPDDKISIQGTIIDGIDGFEFVNFS